MRIIENKKELNRFKLLTLVGSFLLGVGVYVMASAVGVFVEFNGRELSNEMFFKILGWSLYSGVIYAIGIYMCVSVLYKMKEMEENGYNSKDLLKLSFKMIIKITIFIVILIFLDTLSELIGVLYCGISIVLIIGASIIVVTKAIVEELNSKLNNKRKREIET